MYSDGLILRIVMRMPFCIMNKIVLRMMMLLRLLIGLRILRDIYEQDCAEDDDAIAAFNRIADIARYTKNYEEILERKGKSHGMYRFSDEREWRYVPEIDSSCEMYYAGKNFDEDARMAASESVKDYRLDFEADDIKYIIIASEDEVPSFVDSLRDLRRFSSREVERITARVLTAEQIKSDF
ncbi:hypothetical protein AO067_05180 [Pseudomonas viridiflava ICMP 13104]|uniref:Uncharacterized protein n=1 Tax=Pseudomonas viridiflava ICMP 13104 TaxID=1198305 RepID=A0A0W0HE42_PSEVI|nr:hypothetical protein AO067_05180 [Pseudomonas viridiflava ICMP 13104]